MQKKIRVAQFVPYFPPHTGGVEQYAADFALNFVALNAGEMLIFTPDIEQVTKQQTLNGYRIISYPAFEIVHNFPFPKFWQRGFWMALKEVKKWGASVIITHTRFFAPSLLGGIFAKLIYVKWIHIEHGSGWVDSGNKFVDFCSWLYDQIIGRGILRYSDRQICVSRDVERFIRGELGAKNTQVIYRGVELRSITPRAKQDGKIVVGYIGRLIKWKNVENFIRAMYQLDSHIRNNCHFVIVGDGPEILLLRSLDTENIFEFTGNKPFEEALAIQASFDIHMHCSSQGGGLATTLLQAMHFGCMIVATPFEGAGDVIIHGKNGILLEDESQKSITLGMKRTYENIKSRDIFAQENKCILKKQFSWESAIDKFVKNFRKYE